MDNIVDFIFLDANKAFLVSGLILLGLVIVEILFALVGFSMSEASHALGIGKPDLDKPEIGKADIDKGGFNVISWMNAGQVPFVVFLVAFLSTFSIVGYSFQWIVAQVFNTPLNGYLAVSIALIPTIFWLRILTRAIAVMIPREYTTAVYLDSLEGSVGPVTIKTMPLVPGQARIKDAHGTIHYVRILPEGDEAIEQGTDVVLLSSTNHVFTVRKI